MKKTFLFLAALLTATVMNLHAETAYNVKYIDADGVEQTCPEATVVEEASTQVTWNAGWYLVQGNFTTFSKGVVCNGAVHIIIKDYADVTIQGTDKNAAGINVSGDNNSLTIYGQAKQNGTLRAFGGENGAGIGGGNNTANSKITINSGIVAVQGGVNGAGIGGGNNAAGSNITINGGAVDAIGGDWAAGIGGGRGASGSNITINGGRVRTYSTTSHGGDGAAGIGGGAGGDGSNITINGGSYIEATGTNWAAGIGGGGYGGSGSNITINGGNNIQAKSVGHGAGIGGGNQGNGTNITITGGEVHASCDGNGPGIGGGAYGIGSYITISGGDVYATGGGYAAGIGGGSHGGCSNITISGGNVLAKGGKINCYDCGYLDGIGVGYEYLTPASNIFVNPLSVLMADDQNIPTTLIAEDRTESTDLTSVLSGKRNVRVLTFEPITYLAPVYNTESDPSSGIKEWKTLTCTNYTEVTSVSAMMMVEGWYVVKGTDVSLPYGAGCTGAVHLILADDAKLTVNGYSASGIIVSGDANSLTIYGQANQTGQLIATGSQYCAGIGGISGNAGGHVTINGGKVTATGGDYGAGIGGGYQGTGSNITINGGAVTATGGNGGTCIGNGKDCSTEADKIFVNPSSTLKAGANANPTDEIAHATITTDVASDLAGKRYATATAPEPVAYRAPVYNTEGDPTSGIKEWKTLTCPSYTVVNGASSQVTWNAGWYVVTGTDVTLSAGATCNGKVNLILADGAKLTANGDGDNEPAGITVSGDDNSLTIYGQIGQTGQLIATGGYEAAGIGGGSGRTVASAGSNITINGGIVTATGHEDGGAGIGGGNGSGSNITINGGKVTATGKYYAAGIGGGNNGSGSNITINGGEVTATGNEGAAGIGGGQNALGSDITINNGAVNAVGGDYAAGIGGGSNSAGSDIAIHGGTVTATGGKNAAGIGGGSSASGSNITIYGGTVTATGGEDGAGIGGGNAASGSNITIYGGTVTATGGSEYADGIGGYNGNSENVFVYPMSVLKADEEINPPTTVIAHASITTDVSSSLQGKRYVTITPIIVLSETDLTTADLTDLKDKTVNVIIGRTMKRNGVRHTICLPFDLSESEFAASPFAGCSLLQEFSSATIENQGKDNETLVLEMTDAPALAIEAGKPYIIAWPNNGTKIENPQFNDVFIKTDVAEKVTSGEVSFCGTLVPYQVEAFDKDILFINPKGILNWPDVGGKIKGFRSYFSLKLAPGSPLRRGMAAMLGEGRTTPTSVEDASCNMYHVRKLIEEGRVVIISNGVRYDMNGNLVK